MKSRILAILFGLLACAALPVQALVVFIVPLSGAQEVPPASTGDPNGLGTAALIIDETLAIPTIRWVINTQNIELPPTLAHIHQAPAGVNGPVVVDFSAQLVGGPLADSDLTGVLANPGNHYVNIHNVDFPGGAVRGQLAAPIPEASTWAMMLAGLGAVIWMARRRAA